MSNSKKELPAFCPSHDDAVLTNDLARVAEIIDELIPGRGKEIAVKVSIGTGGTLIYFPQKNNLFRDIRDQWIIEQYSAGHRVQDISREVNVCERQIWNILGK